MPWDKDAGEYERIEHQPEFSFTAYHQCGHPRLVRFHPDSAQGIEWREKTEASECIKCRMQSGTKLIQTG